MEILRFQSHHLDALRRLYLASRLATFTWLDTGAYKLSDFEHDTEGEAIWVAVESDEVLGFVSIWEPDCFVHHLFVSPEDLGRGIGTKLLNVVKQRYANLCLKCLTQNSHAVAFYFSQGFKVVETIENGLQSHHLMSLIDPTKRQAP
jgi:ribosomal protein S18 acetylase RimI-like enzyme